MDLLGIEIPCWYFLMWWLPNGKLLFYGRSFSPLYVVYVCVAYMTDSSQKQNKRAYSTLMTTLFSLAKCVGALKTRQIFVWHIHIHIQINFHTRTQAQYTKDKLNEFPVHFRDFTKVNCSNLLRQ